MADIDHPTPVQGEALPVVGQVEDGRMTWNSWSGDQVLPNGALVTDHAQATAEIARLQGEVDRWYGEAAALAFRPTAEEFSALQAKLSTALAESGEMKCKLDKATLVAVAMLAVCYAVEKKNPRNPMGRLSIEDYSEKMVAEIERKFARHTTTQDS